MPPLSAPSGFADAPNDGLEYVRENGVWVTAFKNYEQTFLKASTTVVNQPVIAAATQIVTIDPQLTVADPAGVISIFFNQVFLNKDCVLDTNMDFVFDYNNLNYAVGASLEFSCGFMGSVFRLTTDVIPFDGVTLFSGRISGSAHGSIENSGGTSFAGKINATMKPSTNANPIAGTMSLLIEDSIRNIGIYKP